MALPMSLVMKPSRTQLHVKRLHATILHQLGLDPNRLAYLHAGLDQRLVGTEGADPIRELMS